MKIGTWGKTNTFIFLLLHCSFSFSCYYHSGRHSSLERRLATPRQLNKMAIKVGRQHNKVRQNQQKLVQAFKESVSGLEAKPGTLHSIAAAIANKTRFKPFLNGQKTIEQSIDAFASTPGFLHVFARLIEGTVRNNAAHFNGALAEIQVALRKSREDKKVVEFNRVITDERGKIITELDLISEDKNGRRRASEVKSGNIDKISLDKQIKIQRASAAALGINEYEVVILHKK